MCNGLGPLHSAAQFSICSTSPSAVHTAADRVGLSEATDRTFALTEGSGRREETFAKS